MIRATNSNSNSNINSNGRVDIEGPNINLKFAMMDKIPVDDCSSFRDALTGNWNDSPLSLAFFSGKNIQILQNAIRAGVYNKSEGRYTISPQDCDVLKTIMRSMYLQHAVNLSSNYTEQIMALNKLVIDYSITQMYGEIDSYMKYKRDASNMYTLMPYPMLATTKAKTLELKKWF
jgi:hypothetical protein